MNERSVKPSEQTINLQNQAADPNYSIWLEANAGSGKTHVLTQRVVRLLLDGAMAQNILCLTYTKAAAAEMRTRIAKYLAQWALMDDKELRKELKNLTSKEPDENLLKYARTLFAHALETPGGLKINTIHAFCESILHRFSLEANVPVGFRVIEDQERTNLIRSARDKILASAFGKDDSQLTNSIKLLFAQLTDKQIEDTINLAIENSDDLTELLADKEKAKKLLHKIMKCPENETIEKIHQEILNSPFLPVKDYKKIFAICPPNPGRNRFEDILFRIDRDNPQINLIFSAFLKKNGSICANFPKKQLKEAPNGLGELLLNEAKRLSELYFRKKRLKIVEQSSAFIDILSAIFTLYEKEKRALLSLDYADLIAKTRHLLSKTASKDWVLYKLDANISHILVDESQDTNRQQWEVISELWADFFAGKSAIEKERTIFAVGDKKQSIFSFQGARPELFANTGKELAKRAKYVTNNFTQSELKTSFRTLENILLGVDKVFANEKMKIALLSEGKKISHQSARTDKGGAIIFWPPISPRGENKENNEWPIEANNEATNNAAYLLAKRITDNIRDWIDNERPLAKRNRPIRADDILILLQKRDILFYEIIRALKIANIPTPGSDRLLLSSHIGVMDLLALADSLLNPFDDLTLATILRSPLFNISEDLLYKIAAKRKKNTPLWHALAKAKNKNALNAYETLFRWRTRLDFERPFEFFSQILFQEGGLKRFHQRLGNEVDDIFSQFLDLALQHEKSAQPSLQGFVANIRKSEITIKRELAEKGNGVRIMSVHGAKGLEAPIVILADSTLLPRDRGKSLYYYRENNKTTLLYANNAENRVGMIEQLYQNDKENENKEYWRKLYVAMTRAEDELYLTGILNAKNEKQDKLEQSWYGAVKNALKNECEKCKIINSDEEGLIFPKKREKIIPPKKQTIITDIEQEEFSAAKIKLPIVREIIKPSLAYQSIEYNYEIDNEAVLAQSSANIKEAELSKKQGLAIHALLEHLSKIEPHIREKVAQKALNILLPDHKEKHKEIISKALKIISNPKFQFIFADNSRAEVPFFVNGTKNKKPISIVGRLDRIIINNDRVWIIDFKTDENIAKNITQLAKPYMVQMALYAAVGRRLFANKKINIAILWTKDETLLEIPENILEKIIAELGLDLSNISNY